MNVPITHNTTTSIGISDTFRIGDGADAVTAHDVKEIVKFFRYLIQTDHAIAQEYVAFRAKERIFK